MGLLVLSCLVDEEPNFYNLENAARKGMLSNRSCRVKVHNNLSNLIELKAGVPQGSVLSPLLYIVFCSDFPISGTFRTKTRMFADDTAIWTSHRSAEKATSIIQEELHRIKRWTNH
ncbi:hypothetical protein GEV33_008505 [Tenebrio molitor]|uniref:Reverse transcriptase domain-containing protein n=1 Tax=Tenebrio molitor TaxID=7067 RepID=A0A8J6HHM5_TENMO|nr:hypothetical protein GEV33_008505 [Tenebrio molitor]